MSLSVQPNPRVPFRVLHEDDALLVVEKPAGLVTQPGKGHARDSLLNGLFAVHGNLLQNLGAERDWGLLHRLDRDTSGVLVVALRPRAYDALRRQFEERQVRKTYWAITLGVPERRQATIQSAITEVTRGGQKRAELRHDGRPAVTAFRVLAISDSVANQTPMPVRRSRAPNQAAANEFALVEARPATGRLHQIRVHLASIDCPIAGDELYGRPSAALRGARLCLHAAEISFTHPAESRRLVVRSPLPDDLSAVLKRLGLLMPVANVSGAPS